MSGWGERAIFIFYFHNFLGRAVGDPLDFAPPRGAEADAGAEQEVVVAVRLPGWRQTREDGGVAIRTALEASGFTRVVSSAERPPPDEL